MLVNIVVYCRPAQSPKGLKSGGSGFGFEKLDSLSRLKNKTVSFSSARGPSDKRKKDKEKGKRSFSISPESKRKWNAGVCFISVSPSRAHSSASAFKDN